MAAKGTVERRRLRVELRRIRLQLGLTQKKVSEGLDWSLSKVNRIEAGNAVISKSDLLALLTFYGIKDQGQIDALQHMAQAARKPSRWTPYQDILNDNFITFLEYEDDAAEIAHYNLHLIPGLLQTEEYAHAVLKDIFRMPEPRAKRLVQARMERQQVLEGDDAPNSTFLLDESVLRRWIGGKRVMGHQLERLATAAQQPNVTVRAIALERGVYSGKSSAWAILGFSEPEEDDVLYVEEGPGGQATIRDNKETVIEFKDEFDRLLQFAWTERELSERVSTLITEISRS